MSSCKISLIGTPPARYRRLVVIAYSVAAVGSLAAVGVWRWTGEPMGMPHGRGLAILAALAVLGGLAIAALCAYGWILLSEYRLMAGTPATFTPPPGFTFTAWPSQLAALDRQLRQTGGPGATFPAYFTDYPRATDPRAILGCVLLMLAGVVTGVLLGMRPLDTAIGCILLVAAALVGVIFLSPEAIVVSPGKVEWRAGRAGSRTAGVALHEVSLRDAQVDINLSGLNPGVFIQAGGVKKRILLRSAAEMERFALVLLAAAPPPEPWPFDQPRTCTTITMRRVLNGSEPILLVSHDADDHCWQFIGSSDADVSDGRVVCLEHMVRLDPTVLEVADLPPGWQAVRSSLGAPWIRRPRPADAENEE